MTYDARRWVIAVLALTVMALMPYTAAATSERRVALVIGIDRYPALPPTAQLAKAVADARAVRAVLQQRMGFDDVVYGENVTLGEARDLMLTFSKKVTPGALAFVYFAGHGMNVRLGNYLLPSDVPALRDVTTEAQLRLEEESLVERSLSEERIRELVTLAGAKSAIVVLDACRNNVVREILAAGGARTRSLAAATQVQGARPVERAAVTGRTQFISLYSASPGQRALDNLGPGDTNANSPFTRVLIERLPTPGVRIYDLLRGLRTEVVRLAASAGHDQVPAIADETLDDIVLVAAQSGAPSVSPQISMAPPPVPSNPAPAVAKPAASSTPPATPSVPAAAVPANVPKAVPSDWVGWTLAAATRGTEAPLKVAHWALSPDQRSIAASYGDRTVRLWSLDSGQQLGLLRGVSEVQQALVFSPDGRWLAGVPQRSGVITVYDTARRDAALTLPWSVDSFAGFAFSGDGASLVVRDRRGAITVFDLATRQPRAATPADAGWLQPARTRDGLQVNMFGGALRVGRGTRGHARLLLAFQSNDWVGIGDDGVSFTGSRDRVAAMELVKGRDRLPVTAEFLAAHYRAAGLAR